MPFFYQDRLFSFEKTIQGKDNAVWALFADSERPSNARFIYGHFYQLL